MRRLCSTARLWRFTKSSPSTCQSRRPTPTLSTTVRESPASGPSQTRMNGAAVEAYCGRRCIEAVSGQPGADPECGVCWSSRSAEAQRQGGAVEHSASEAHRARPHRAHAAPAHSPGRNLRRGPARTWAPRRGMESRADVNQRAGKMSSGVEEPMRHGAGLCLEIGGGTERRSTRRGQRMTVGVCVKGTAKQTT